MSPARRAHGPSVRLRRGLARAALAVTLLLPLSPAAGQGTAADTASGAAAADTLTLEGRVLRGTDSIPVTGQTVVLHRVAPEGGSPVDSVRTGPGGRFAFRVAPSPSVVHLASARYDGVLYLGSAVHGDRLPPAYVVRVWEARSATPGDTVRVRRRSLVLGSGNGGVRVMDVAEVSTPSDRTVAAPGDGDRAWWEVRLPDGARDVRVLPGGVDAGAVRIGDGRARVSAAVPPRGTRLVLGYRLPQGRVLSLNPGPTTERVELVARGVPGQLTVEGLRSAGASTVQGQEVRRWVSDGGAVGPVRITAATPEESGGIPTPAWIAAAVGVLAVAGALFVWRAGGGRSRRREGRG